MSRVAIKRVYEPRAADDGARILVDRLWPRGLSKDKAHVDEWLKDVAPTAALRKWFGHDPKRWDAFRRRYLDELAGNPATARLRELADKGHVTLLYGAHDTEHNQAVVLQEYLAGKGRP
jgi:uncharacterized protein YeaO (DUF488 family)